MQQTSIFTGKEITGTALKNAFDNFILSRQAMRVSPATIAFYHYTARNFIIWAEQKDGITTPPQININEVRAFLAELGGRTNSDWTLNDYARGIRTLLRFWHSEGVIPQPITFGMPKVRKKKMLSLNSDELRQLISDCDTPREKAIILLLADSGLRRAEVIALNWGHINMTRGLCYVNSGKGGKSRVTVIGPATLKALVEYRKTLMKSESEDPLFQARFGSRFTGNGFKAIFIRLSKRSGIRVTPHALRRTFVKLSLRSKINPLHLKDLLGHESLDMVMYYAGQFDEEELLEAHNEHSPIENLFKTEVTC
jgi:integrase